MATPDDPYHQQQHPAFSPQFASPSQPNGQATFASTGYYQNHDPSLQPQPVRPQSGAKASSSNEDSTKNSSRLRKACDNCSIRKVKCDESGPPCKACINLEIPCTFDRPSKRRGPPNRLAESIKKQRHGSPTTSIQSIPTSPTHAAHTLASFAQQQVLSAESICPWKVLHPLINDYFTYIHPLVPVPHEASFRQALDDRQDLHSTTYLTLMASMIGCLTASFPRRPRQHFKEHHLEHLFPSSMSFIDRCQRVAVEAHGPATHNRLYTVHDAIISYLQGITYVYTFQRQPALLYFKEGLSIITSLGLHKAGYMKQSSKTFSEAVVDINGYPLQDVQMQNTDLIIQELEKRTFWCLFVTVKTLHQMGVSPFELNVPPSTKCDPYPPLPTEIDDAYLTTTHMMQPSEGYSSELVGFNVNAKIFASFDAVFRTELNFGVDEIVDWEKQRNDIITSLDNVKRIVDGLPPSFALGWASTQPDAGAEQISEAATGHTPEDRRMQHEIQKANIHATQLSTRSYLVEKYFNLSEAYRRSMSHQSSPTTASGLSSSNETRSADEAMSNEHSEIISSLRKMLSTIQQIHMEPNGASLISKVRSIASTLIDGPRTRKVSLSMDTEQYLTTFVDVLGRLEKTVGATERSNEEDEESKLREWADLRQEQDKFLRVGGFFAGS